MSAPRQWIIYTLKNPRTNEVRYVGWTSQSPEERLRIHIREALNMRRTRIHRRAWIFSLVSIGLIPLIEVIASGTGAGWADAERLWIAFYRAKGARLVNATDGGEGGPDMRAAQLAKMTPEDRRESARNAAVKRWARITPEAREQHREHSKLSNAKWNAKFTHEQRSAMSVPGGHAGGKARAASLTPTRRSEIADMGGAANAARMALWTPAERSRLAKKASMAAAAARDRAKGGAQ